MQNFLFYEQHLKLNFSNILWKFCLFEQHLQCNTRLQFFDYKQNSVPCTVVNMGMRILKGLQDSDKIMCKNLFWHSSFRLSHHLHSFVYIFCFVYILWNLFTFCEICLHSLSLRKWKERKNSNLILLTFFFWQKEREIWTQNTTIGTKLGLT